MQDRFPSPDTRHPITGPDGAQNDGVVFLSAAIKHPRFVAGDYSYASSYDPPKDWLLRLAPYLFTLSKDRLIIGKFCQIADRVVFITQSANHRRDGFSSFPFCAFDGDIHKGRPSLAENRARDTVVGNDVWIGDGARILPGAQIGDGVIIGASSVVGGDVPPYCVVAGNPARIVRQRFDDETIQTLLKIAWWDWPINRILANEAAICGADLDVLKQAAKTA